MSCRGRVDRADLLRATSAVALLACLARPGAVRAQSLDPADTAAAPTPPSERELAEIEDAVHTSEVERVMRFRRRWRGFVDAGLVMGFGVSFYLDRVFATSKSPAVIPSIGGGVRRALLPALEVQLRGLVIAPYPLEYQVAPDVCRPTASTELQRAGMTGVSVLAEAGLRVRPLILWPVYLGASVSLGALFVAGTESLTLVCVDRVRPSSPSTSVTASTGLSVLPLVGAHGSFGVQFGGSEQFELEVQLGTLYYGLGGGSDPPPGGYFFQNIESTLHVRLSFGWSFS